jgi:hypothetical protein
MMLLTRTVDQPAAQPRRCNAVVDGAVLRQDLVFPPVTDVVAREVIVATVHLP